MNGHKSNETRKLAIDYYLSNNISQLEVSKIFQVSEKTFKRWLKQYREDKSIERKSRQLISYKIKEKHVKYILKLVKKNPTWSIQMYMTNIKEKYSDFDISNSQLSRVIRDNNLTRKRTRIRHYPETRYNKPIDFKKEMEIFYEKVDKFSIHKIISIDETSIHAEMTSSYSRCELGRRCVKKTTDNKVFKKFTLVSAISSKGVVGLILYKNGGMTAERMVEFIRTFINKKIKNYLVIMDNGGAHKSHLVKDAIKESKNTLLYSVPYRPKTNAIESWFNQFKHYFKLTYGGISYPDLVKKVKKTVTIIPPKSYLNYMKYAYINKEIRKFIRKQSTRRKTLKNYKS